LHLSAILSGVGRIEVVWPQNLKTAEPVFE
jgi:hypothetical protein